ncbi:MAG TPA: uroporphyrinogen-III synthase [Epsilonproteobacteria bacterium]|nr:uroporphyrinogen-III synthase [Campylobacterota bacterium]
MVFLLLNWKSGLAANRPIYLLSPKAREGTHSLPMITFETVADRIDFSVCDTLMFTSKQAVVTAEAIDPNWKKFPSIAIGPATRRQIERLGGSVIFQPENFYGEQLAKDIVSFLHDRRILYLRPEKISFESKEYLHSSGIELQEQTIYRTSCIQYRSDHQPPESSVIIFTSPSTIHCFLANFNWKQSYTAVVIGQSTKTHLPAESSYVVADEPLIDACLEKALALP